MFIDLQPADAGGSIKPGVERSGTPGTGTTNLPKPAERATERGSGSIQTHGIGRAVARIRGLRLSLLLILGLTPQALC